MLGQKQHKASKLIGDMLAPNFSLKTNAHSQAKPSINYYPFGSSMVGYSNAEYHYSYGMNTQEKDDEIYGEGNSYSAEYWQYDARLGRRWNNDPRPSPSISVYACFGNNPIWFSDVKGDTFDVQSQPVIDNFKKTTQGYLDNTNEQISKLTNEINVAVTNGEDVTQMQNQMQELRLKKFEYMGALSEISRLERSPQAYSVQNSEKDFNYISKQGSVFVMHIRGNSTAGLSHELKHAYQYDIGAYSFMNVEGFEGMPGLLYDMYDEIEAYQRQWAYGEMPIKVNNYSDINTKYTLKVSKVYGLEYSKLINIGSNVTKDTVINEALYQKWFKSMERDLIIGKSMGEIFTLFNNITPFQDFR